MTNGMPHTRTIGPLTPSMREKMNSHLFESLHQQSRTCPPLPPASFIQLVTLRRSRCTVVRPEGYLSEQSSTLIPNSDVFSRGHDPVAHACRAECPAHVGYVIVILLFSDTQPFVQLEVLLVIMLSSLSTGRLHWFLFFACCLKTYVLDLTLSRVAVLVQWLFPPTIWRCVLDICMLRDAM